MLAVNCSIPIFESDDKTKTQVIPEIKLIRKDKDAGYPFPDSGNKKIGNRSKIGGKPDFIQFPPSSTTCNKCHKKMTFYGQLDSINPEFSIEDCGMIYIYYCFNCGHVEAFAQSY